MKREKPKIALFLATSGHSGVDRAMQNLIPELARRGFRVDLLNIRQHGPYLKEAIDGEHGYKVTVGSDLYDYDLTYLVTKPASVPTYNALTGIGWNGPYIIDDGNESYKYDAWENPYVVTATTITSYGLDQTSGTADDIVMEY